MLCKRFNTVRKRVMKLGRRNILGLAAAAALMATAGSAFAAGEKIAVVTPYLAQPGTQFYVEIGRAHV